MTEHISAEDFQRKHGGGVPTKGKLTGEPGYRWSADCGHEGWDRRLDQYSETIAIGPGRTVTKFYNPCPVCGKGRVTSTEWKRPTAAQHAEYLGRNG